MSATKFDPNRTTSQLSGAIRSLTRLGAAASIPAILLGSAAVFGACDGDSEADPDVVDASTDSSDVAEDSALDTALDPEVDTADVLPDVPEVPAICDEFGAAPSAFSAGPYGSLRHEIADDFTIAQADGTDWTLSANWTGCENFVFIPNGIAISSEDRRSIWADGVTQLLDDSPRNTHYWFVVTSGDAGEADAMQEAIVATLDTLAEEDDAHWRDRLHVAAQPVASLGGWIADVFAGIGSGGFAIDREQQIRGVGSYADVTRENAALAAAEQWPWEQNIASAASEAIYLNYEADLDADLASVEATEVEFWDGEVLEHFEDITVQLPSAEQMATFDTFEMVLEARCPNPNAVEFGNCGAWDYLAHMSLMEGEGDDLVRTELARFITPYHREGRWVVDITPMLVLLAEGGERTFRWEFAPEWNTQPTATWVSLRFSNQDRGERPVGLIPLFQGGDFNSTYNERDRVDAEIPASAARVDLYAVISGHGGATQNCAEFCNHQHDFVIGTSSTRIDHPAVGDNQACQSLVSSGVVPNQGGTWWFGRGGWCPGQQVEPYVRDVTRFVTPGETARVRYYGLLDGNDPPDGAGNILMNSYLVIYE